MAKLTDRTELTTPADGDLYVTTDVSDTTDAVTGTDKKITWANIKATLKTYFDTLYAGVLGADDNYVTDAEKTKLANLSGTNTGDQDLSSYLTSATAASTYEPLKGTDDNYVTDAEKVVIGNTSGTNTGDNAVNSNYSGLVSNATHTGDVTGATALTIANGAVTLAKMANVDSATVFYRKTISAGAPEVQTFATLKTDLGLTGTNSGDQTSIVGITGTKAQFDTAVTDGNFMYVGDAPTSHTHTLSAITDVTASVAEVNVLDGIPGTLTATELGYVDGVTSAIQTQLNAKAPIASPTFTGTATAPRLDYTRAVPTGVSIGNLGATETFDWSAGRKQYGNLDSNITISFSNAIAHEEITLFLTYSGAARVITWPTITWFDNATGAAPEEPQASGNVLCVTISYDGTTYFGSATGNYSVYS